MVYPFLLDALTGARIQIVGNAASAGGGALYAQCVHPTGATAAVYSSLTAGPVEEKAAAAWNISGNTAAYGAAAAAQVERLEVDSAEAAGCTPGDVIRASLRLIDGFGQEAQPAAGEQFELLMDVPQLPAAGAGSKEYSVFCDPGAPCDAAAAGVRLPWPAKSNPTGVGRVFSPAVEVGFRFRPPAGEVALEAAAGNLTRRGCGAGSAYDPATGFCAACGVGQYVTDPDGGDCIDCPIGAVCNGAALVGLPTASSWAAGADGVLRLQSCPAGYVLVRDEDRPAQDQCVQCPPGRYSSVPASYSVAAGGPVLWGPDAATAYLLCTPCPGPFFPRLCIFTFSFFSSVRQR